MTILEGLQGHVSADKAALLGFPPTVSDSSANAPAADVTSLRRTKGNLFLDDLQNRTALCPGPPADLSWIIKQETVCPGIYLLQ